MTFLTDPNNFSANPNGIQQHGRGLKEDVGTITLDCIFQLINSEIVSIFDTVTFAMIAK